MTSCNYTSGIQEKNGELATSGRGRGEKSKYSQCTWQYISAASTTTRKKCTCLVTHMPTKTADGSLMREEVRQVE